MLLLINTNTVVFEVAELMLAPLALGAWLKIQFYEENS